MNSTAISAGFELQRTFRASPERVFRAWTQPAALREWWCPAGWVADKIAIDLQIGGAYSIAMSRANARVSVNGEFLEVRPPERLVYTWRWEGAFAEMPETLVTLELRGSDGAVVRRDVAVAGRETNVRLDSPFAPTGIHVDPEGKLLLRATTVVRR